MATGRGCGQADSRRNLYGRHRRRALRPGRRRALETLLPQRAIPGVSLLANPARESLTADALLGGASDCWLEIGFGNGEHLLALARRHPDIAMLGAEPYQAGVGALLAALGADGPSNLRLHPGDGRDLLDVLPDGLVGRVFLLYPDPWPKKRHAFRRIVSAENLDALARVMRTGAELRFASDVPVMRRHAHDAIQVHPGFDRIDGPPFAWRRAWPEWTGTRYEAKAIAAGRRPLYFTCRRNRHRAD